MTIERQRHPRPPGETDDVSGAAAAASQAAIGRTDEPEDAGDAVDAGDANLVEHDANTAAEEPPPRVAELAAACVRFVAARYGTAPDFEPDTLSLLDQWVRDARAETPNLPEAGDLVAAAGGAYLGEVIRRAFGARWVAEGDPASWKLCLSSVYCAFNPIGMVREALLLAPAEGYNAHLELDPGEGEAIAQRLAALPVVSDDEYYAPTTRFDVLCILVDALRAAMQSRGLADVRFGLEDYV